MQAYSDLDNDGDLDIVVSNINAEAFIYENKLENGNYLEIEVFSENNLSTLGTKIELTRQDGSTLYEEITPIRGMYSTSQQRAHFGLGNDEVVSKILVTLPDNQKFSLKNIVVNQRLKLEIEDQILQNIRSRKARPLYLKSNKDQVVHLENEFDDYSKQVLLPHKLSQLGPAIAVADINNDGHDDFFAGGAVGVTGSIYLSDGKSGFKKSKQEFSSHSNCEDVSAEFIDVDNDGDFDLYVVSGGNEYAPQSIFYQDRLYINSDGIFSESLDYKLPIFRESGSVVKAFDYNTDGLIDLFIGGRIQPWSYPSPTTSRLLQNTGSGFKDVTAKNARDLAMIGMITDAEWFDYDEDGDHDILIVGEWMPITLLRNNDGTFEKETILENSEGWWNALEIVDLDRDGTKEILLGNLGLNYKYKATLQEPFEVFYDDFDENGQKDIVLSYYNFGEQFPLRGRSCSAQQVPTIGEDFPSYDIFASSNLETVYGKEELDEALHLSAYNFSSGYLKKNSTGDYDFIAFPNELQFSSINDFLSLDGTTKSQFIAIGNNYVAEIETQRNDASVGIHATWNEGKIVVSSPLKSGIYTQKDARKIKQIKGKTDGFVIATNNDSWDFYITNKNLKQ